METTPLQNEIQDRKRPFTLTKSKRVSCLQIMRFLHICQCYCILSFLPHWVEFIFFYFFFLFLYCLLFTSVLSSCAKKLTTHLYHSLYAWISVRFGLWGVIMQEWKLKLKFHAWMGMSCERDVDFSYKYLCFIYIYIGTKKCFFSFRI